VFGATFLITVIIVALGIFALKNHFKENKNKSLILCGLFITPLLLALFTEQPSRWLYFLPIPIFICFGLFLNDLFSYVKKVRKEILFVVISLILIISLESTISSVNRMETSMSYYQSIGKDEIDALNWINHNTLSNSTFTTSGPDKIIGEDTSPGSSYSWWIEGLAQRKSFHTGLPSWYTYQDERFETKLMNRVFAGSYIIESGDLRISDVFPSAMENPEIAVLLDDHYQNVIFLNDAEPSLFFSPIGNDKDYWQNSLFDASNKTITFFSNGTYANITYAYSMPNFILTRSIVEGLDTSSVDIYFNMTTYNSLLQEFKIDFWPSYYTSILNYVENNSTINLNQKLLLSNKIVNTTIEVLEINGLLNGTKVFNQDPKYSIPLISYSIRPLGDNLYLHFRLSINNDELVNSNHLVQFYNSYNLLKNAKVDYIFLNKNRAVEFNRFINDTDHYAEIFENPTIVIMKVL
jgi:hypothetical protein